MANRQREWILPLFHVLSRLKPDHRVILLAHLDNASRDSLYAAINSVLKDKGGRLPFRRKLRLRNKLKPYKRHFRHLCSEGESSGCKKRRLAQVGGAPMGYVLKEIIPLLMDVYPE